MLSLNSFLICADDILPEDELEIDYTIDAIAMSADPENLNAKSAILVEAKSMRILYEKNAFVKRQNASTTKILTAIVAIEMGNPEDVVTISSKAANIGGSTINLKKGEKLKLLELLYGLMLKSGNDAAIAIAEHIGGSVEEFMDLVNKKAKEIGANNTHFTSPHGLDEPDHYTTAYDLALITSYCMKNDLFRQIVSTAETYISDRHLRNTNDLIFTYAGANGVKTGFTNGAGRCLVASANRNGMEVISVVLGCDNKTTRFRDSRILFDYAFKNYEMVKLVETGEVIKSINIKKGLKQSINAVAGETIEIPLTKEEKEIMEKKYNLLEVINAPVNKGVIVGTLYYVCHGDALAEVDLLIEEDVCKKGVFDFFTDIFKEWLNVI